MADEGAQKNNAEPLGNVCNTTVVAVEIFGEMSPIQEVTQVDATANSKDQYGDLLREIPAGSIVGSIYSQSSRVSEKYVSRDGVVVLADTPLIENASQPFSSQVVTEFTVADEIHWRKNWLDKQHLGTLTKNNEPMPDEVLDYLALMINHHHMKSGDFSVFVMGHDALTNAGTDTGARMNKKELYEVLR